jgi:hypothetical protein
MKNSNFKCIGPGPPPGAWPALTARARASLSAGGRAHLRLPPCATCRWNAAAASRSRCPVGLRLGVDPTPPLGYKGRFIGTMPRFLSPHSPLTPSKTEPRCRQIPPVSSLAATDRSCPSEGAPNPCASSRLGLGAGGRPPVTGAVFPPPPGPDAGESPNRALPSLFFACDLTLTPIGTFSSWGPSTSHRQPSRGHCPPCTAAERR